MRGRDIGRRIGRLPMGSLMQDSIPRPRDHNLSQKQMLNYWAIQMKLFLWFLMINVLSLELVFLSRECLWVFFFFSAFKTFSCLQFSDVLIECVLVEISLKCIQSLEFVRLYFVKFRTSLAIIYSNTFQSYSICSFFLGL